MTDREDTADKELLNVVSTNEGCTEVAVTQKPPRVSTRRKSGDASYAKSHLLPRSNAENALQRLHEEYQQQQQQQQDPRFCDGLRTKRSRSPFPGDLDKKIKGPPTKGPSSLTDSDRGSDRRADDVFNRGISTTAPSYASSVRSSTRGDNGMWAPETNEDRFNASQDSPYVQQLVTMPSQEDGMHPRNLSLSERLPRWLWLLLTRSLGVRLGPREKPIIATALHIFTLTAAFGFAAAGGWFKISDIYSEYTRTTALMGLVSCIIGLAWICLGIYAHKLAARLMNNDQLVDSVRLHSKTFLKISTAALAALLSLGGLGMNFYNAFSDFGADKCEKAGAHAMVCYVALACHIVFSLLCLAWNLVVSFILFSLCRTHTVRIRRFGRELAVDGKKFEMWWLENLSESAAQRHQELFPGLDYGYFPDDSSSIAESYDNLHEDEEYPTPREGEGETTPLNTTGGARTQTQNKGDYNQLPERYTRVDPMQAESTPYWNRLQRTGGVGYQRMESGGAGDSRPPLRGPSNNFLENPDAAAARRKVERWRERMGLYAGMNGIPDYGSTGGTPAELQQSSRNDRGFQQPVPDPPVVLLSSASRGASAAPSLVKDTEGSNGRRKHNGMRSETSSVHGQAEEHLSCEGPPILSNTDLFISHWKLNKRLLTTSRYLQRWMVSWIFFIFLWCGDFVVVWTSNPANMLGITEFTIPLALLLLLTSAYAEVNGEGQRLVKSIIPMEKRLPVIQYFNIQPLQLLVFSFSITYNALMGVILAFSIAFASRIILDEVMK